MIITIVGLGLIGASLAKAIKANTTHTVVGIDTNAAVIEKALYEKSIDAQGNSESLSQSDLTIVCLYPNAIIEYVTANAGHFKKGSVVIDSCGVKRSICSALKPVAAENGFIFIGAHPMAGKEKNGYAYSDEQLFNNASMILTPEQANAPAVELLRELSLSIGFKNVTIATPDEHDRIIAYTSQMPHVLACAYVSDPDAVFHKGFSAGSYIDISRVADINAPLWDELFISNRDNLSAHIRRLIKQLESLDNMITGSDEDALTQTLRESQKTKQRIG